jgi:hypothetical protein
MSPPRGLHQVIHNQIGTMLQPYRYRDVCQCATVLAAARPQAKQPDVQLSNTHKYDHAEGADLTISVQFSAACSW